jgi:hypothetical protein
LRPLPTVLIGVVGGLVVGMTSVGSGSLMIVLLLLYPMLRSSELVGAPIGLGFVATLAYFGLPRPRPVAAPRSVPALASGRPRPKQLSIGVLQMHEDPVERFK